MMKFVCKIVFLFLFCCCCIYIMLRYVFVWHVVFLWRNFMCTWHISAYNHHMSYSISQFQTSFHSFHVNFTFSYFHRVYIHLCVCMWVSNFQIRMHIWWCFYQMQFTSVWIHIHRSGPCRRRRRFSRNGNTTSEFWRTTEFPFIKCRFSAKLCSLSLSPSLPVHDIHDQIIHVRWCLSLCCVLR